MPLAECSGERKSVRQATPIAALKAKRATNTRVKRDGNWVTPPARELVERTCPWRIPILSVLARQVQA
jgi:hypothetical protein